MKAYITAIALLISIQQLTGQSNALVNTANSPFAKLQSVNMEEVNWTSGFWAERFEVCRNSTMPHLWNVYTDAQVSHAFKNFEIAAGLDTGRHLGPPFHDGDFYKILEGIASLYAVTGDERLNEMMDRVIPVIARAQRRDGYIHTRAIIEQQNNPSQSKEFGNQLNFETYNIGHLMTAACVHYRATGKRSLLDIAIRATDFLDNYYQQSSAQLSRNTICPSHYMGIIEMYRTTRNKTYLSLAKNLINIRGTTNDGTDDNQDRIPFREQKEAMGHAVRANYLYAGVADVYTETGDTSLLQSLNSIWNDVVNKKMYLTGACGALYDGVSPYGTSYLPSEIQKTHQAYGRAYQLPNMTAHNETCANIGNVLWNWRMFLVTGEAKYADITEIALYNSVLSGISLDGNEFSYTNPLSASDNFSYDLRWSGGRLPYIRRSNCCPPNAFRTIAEVSHYAYSLSDKGIWFNLYGSSTLSTTLNDGSKLKLLQETNYPWEGTIHVTLKQVPTEAFSLFFRIPEWTSDAHITINGNPKRIGTVAGEYAEIHRPWRKGDVIEVSLPMSTTLVEANPLVEETRNQVAVKRGPIVYCLEETDLPESINVSDIVIPASAIFRPHPILIDGANMMGLKGEVLCVDNSSFQNQLYRIVSDSKPVKKTITLIPYYAWGNRGPSNMTVWMPLDR